MNRNTILLLHGALGAKSQLTPLQTLLSETLDCYVMNFEGHGDRPSDHEYSISRFSKNISDYILEMNLNKPHIFGYSMAGYAALNLAQRHSDAIGKIITLGTKFNWTPEGAQKEVKMLDPEKILEKVPAFAAHLEHVHSANLWKNVLQKTSDMMIRLGDSPLLNKEILEQINNDVLIMLGELDHMVTEAESIHAAVALPNGTFRKLEGTKHPIEKVNIELLASRIQEFITS